MDYACRTERLLFSAWPREAVVVGPLREGEGVKAGPLRKNNFFEALKKVWALAVGPLRKKSFF